jgi:hypothetical protein
MRPDLVEVGSVILQNATQLRFVEHHQVVERFALDRADEALDMAVSATVSAAQSDDRAPTLA